MQKNTQQLDALLIQWRSFHSPKKKKRTSIFIDLELALEPDMNIDSEIPHRPFSQCMIKYADYSSQIPTKSKIQPIVLAYYSIIDIFITYGS